MELPNSGTCWKTVSAYSVYPMWALKEKKPFSLKDRVVIFPVGPVSCHRTDGFLYFCFRSATFLPLIRPVSGETAHHRLMCVIAWSGLCSASRSFQMPSTPACFPSLLLVGCEFPLSVRMSSWYRSCWLLDQCSVWTSRLLQAVVSTCCSPKECRKLYLGWLPVSSP